MKQAKHKESESWQEVFLGRREKQRVKRRWRWNGWRLLLVVSYILIAGALWSVLAIYGPVLAAEMGYQAKRLSSNTNGSWGWLVPNFSLQLVPEAFADGYGIVIPKIYVSEPVIPNVNPNDKGEYRQALNRGIAHAAGTSLPGEAGLGYYFAHSSGLNPLAPQKQAIFYLLGKLTAGDEVQIWHEGEEYRYRVTETRITQPDEVGFLEETNDGERIVLQTCWPIGTSLQRLLVFGERM